MTETLKSWVFGIVGASFITAITQAITPEVRAKRVVAIVCGFVLMLAILSPICAFDYGSLQQSMARYGDDAAAITQQLDAANENIERSIIAERFAAYISDKSAARGVTAASVVVEVEHSDGAWLPASVAIVSDADATQRAAVEYDIEAALGIAPQDITWREG